MEGAEQVKRFKEFLESNYHPKLLKMIRKGQSFIVIDFSDLLKFNPELADELLEDPEEVIKAGEIAIQEFDLPDNLKNFKIRFNNLPEDQKIMIRNIRSKHINKLFVMEGVVRQKSDVRPQVTSARFECPNCGNIINVLQLDTQFKEPNKCGCGRKGKFRLLTKELVDAQGIVLEEAPEIIPETAEEALRALADELDLSAGQLFGILRSAVTGRKVSPPLFQTMAIFGKETVLERIDNAVKTLETMDLG